MPTDQQPLPGIVGRYRPGTIERHARKDMRDLRPQLPKGCDALQAAYIQLARELDRAEKSEDTWVKINATREMLKIRLALVPSAGVDDGDTPESFIASLPAAAVGDVTPIGKAKSRR